MSAVTTPAGDDLVFEVQIVASGENADLSQPGTKVRYRVEGLDDDKTVGDGITLTDAENGLVSVRVDRAELFSLGRGTFRHEMKILLNGLVSTVFGGHLIIENSLIGEDEI